MVMQWMCCRTGQTPAARPQLGPARSGRLSCSTCMTAHVGLLAGHQGRTDKSRPCRSGTTLDRDTASLPYPAGAAGTVQWQRGRCWWCDCVAAPTHSRTAGVKHLLVAECWVGPDEPRLCRPHSTTGLGPGCLLASSSPAGWLLTDAGLYQRCMLAGLETGRR